MPSWFKTALEVVKVAAPIIVNLLCKLWQEKVDEENGKKEKPSE